MCPPHLLSSAPRFLNPLHVTGVTPGEDIQGIHNFDIFVIQEGREGEVTHYDQYITARVREVAVTLRPRYVTLTLTLALTLALPTTLCPRSGAEVGVLQLTLDSTQGVNHVIDKVAPILLSVNHESRRFALRCL